MKPENNQGFNVQFRWSPDFFFFLIQASSFQLLRLSFFTFIYTHSTNMIYFIYTSIHFTLYGKIWTQLIDLSHNVWLHRSVGRASHRHGGGHRFESLWGPDFFQASFQLLTLANLLQWSFFTFSKLFIWIHSWDQCCVQRPGRKLFQQTPGIISSYPSIPPSIHLCMFEDLYIDGSIVVFKWTVGQRLDWSTIINMQHILALCLLSSLSFDHSPS